jgi:outer membrane immunogenic protein
LNDKAEFRKREGRVIKRRLVPAVAIVLGSVLPASAQSAAPADWKGLYVGVSLGAALEAGTAETTTVFSPTGYFATTSVPAIAAAGSFRLTPRSFMAGGLIGYNIVQRGRLVIGAEADLSAMEARSSSTNTAVYPCCAPTTFTVGQSLETDWLFTLRPRVGLTAGPNFALPATAAGPSGHAAVNVEGDASLSPNQPLAFTSAFPARQMQIGFRLTY